MAAILGAIAVAHLQPRLFAFPFRSRASIHEELGDQPDGAWRPYARFLQNVRAHTSPGDTVAVVAPGASSGAATTAC